MAAELVLGAHMPPDQVAAMDHATVKWWFDAHIARMKAVRGD